MIRSYAPVVGAYPMSATDLVVQGWQPQSGPPLQSPALLHPYGLAFDPQTGALYQSSQDTNVVSGYSLNYAGATVTASAVRRRRGRGARAGDAAASGGKSTQTYSIYRIGHHSGINAWATAARSALTAGAWSQEKPYAPSALPSRYR